MAQAFLSKTENGLLNAGLGDQPGDNLGDTVKQLASKVNRNNEIILTTYDQLDGGSDTFTGLVWNEQSRMLSLQLPEGEIFIGGQNGVSQKDFRTALEEYSDIGQLVRFVGDINQLRTSDLHQTYSVVIVSDTDLSQPGDQAYIYWWNPNSTLDDSAPTVIRPNSIDSFQLGRWEVINSIPLDLDQILLFDDVPDDVAKRPQPQQRLQTLVNVGDATHPAGIYQWDETSTGTGSGYITPNTQSGGQTGRWVKVDSDLFGGSSTSDSGNGEEAQDDTETAARQVGRRIYVSQSGADDENDGFKETKPLHSIEEAVTVAQSLYSHDLKRRDALRSLQRNRPLFIDEARLKIEGSLGSPLYGSKRRTERTLFALYTALYKDFILSKRAKTSNRFILQIVDSLSLTNNEQSALSDALDHLLTIIPPSVGGNLSDSDLLGSGDPYSGSFIVGQNSAYLADSLTTILQDAKDELNGNNPSQRTLRPDSEPPTVILLDAGRYHLQRPINVPDHVAIIGDSPQQTIIEASSRLTVAGAGLFTRLPDIAGLSTDQDSWSGNEIADGLLRLKDSNGIGIVPVNTVNKGKTISEIEVNSPPGFPLRRGDVIYLSDSTGSKEVFRVASANLTNDQFNAVIPVIRRQVDQTISANSNPKIWVAPRAEWLAQTNPESREGFDQTQKTILETDEAIVGETLFRVGDGFYGEAIQFHNYPGFAVGFRHDRPAIYQSPQLTNCRFSSDLGGAGAIADGSLPMAPNAKAPSIINPYRENICPYLADWNRRGLDLTQSDKCDPHVNVVYLQDNVIYTYLDNCDEVNVVYYAPNRNTGCTVIYQLLAEVQRRLYEKAPEILDSLTTLPSENPDRYKADLKLIIEAVAWQSVRGGNSRIYDRVETIKASDNVDNSLFPAIIDNQGGLREQMLNAVGTNDAAVTSMVEIYLDLVVAILDSNKTDPDRTVPYGEPYFEIFNRPQGESRRFQLDGCNQVSLFGGYGHVAVKNGQISLNHSHIAFADIDVKTESGGEAQVTGSRSRFGYWGLAAGGHADAAYISADAAVEVIGEATAFYVDLTTLSLNSSNAVYGAENSPYRQYFDSNNLLLDQYQTDPERVKQLISEQSVVVFTSSYTDDNGTDVSNPLYRQAVAVETASTADNYDSNANTGQTLKVIVRHDQPIPNNYTLSQGATIEFFIPSLIAATGHTFDQTGAGNNALSAFPESGRQSQGDFAYRQGLSGLVLLEGQTEDGRYQVGEELTVDQSAKKAALQNLTKFGPFVNPDASKTNIIKTITDQPDLTDYSGQVSTQALATAKAIADYVDAKIADLENRLS